MNDTLHAARSGRPRDAAHFLHPFTDFQALATKGSRVITRGDGIYLWDSDGQRILDAMSGLWCVNVGYGQRGADRRRHAAARDAAVLQRLLPDRDAAGDRARGAAGRSLTPPQFQHVFFTGSGSEGNDTDRAHGAPLLGPAGPAAAPGDHQPLQRATTARRWPARRSAAWRHARAGRAADPRHRAHRAAATGSQQRPTGSSREEFGIAGRRAGWKQKILEVGADKVAAFIGEPVQGAGGVIVPPATYWPEIQRICDQHGILLISDEVICGFGRTGHWFGCETFGTTPDLMTFAKGVTSGYVPLGGVMVGERVAQGADRAAAASSSTATPTPATRWPARWRSPTSG